MFQRLQIIGFAVAMLAGCQLGAAAGLAEIDRSIGREPEYKSTPEYCLLVFGRAAQTRVWIVEDGETIYVDRNANGDLTEDGEAILPVNKRDLGSYRDATYQIGEIVPADGAAKHTDFELAKYQTDDDPVCYVVKVRVHGKLRQFAGWRPIFARSPDDAAVFHFGGEFTPRPLREKELSLTRRDQEVHLCLFTPGCGEGAKAMLGYEAVPQGIAPLAEIQWPSADSGKTIQSIVKLTRRC